mmetsp:Transcript_15731/g.21041  ORF Transcript_15731/g.21041 Transcript_15731/m.21041 type:complete len:555 (+) Transcript_15731:78-1742(+)
MKFTTLSLLALIYNNEVTNASLLRARLNKQDSLSDLQLGDYFSEAYASGESWFVGLLASDMVNFGSAVARAKVGLMTSGSLPIGNFYPWPEGMSTTDGILGLARGCFGDCGEEYTDTVSNLVRGGALSAHVFTMCLVDGATNPEGGGALFLGPSDKGLPEGTVKIPVSATGMYFVQPPSQGTVNITLGDKLLKQYSPEEWIYPIVDSGTGGLSMPQELLNGVVEEAKNIASNQCKAQCQNIDIELYNDLSQHFPKSCAVCINTAMPDFVADLGSDKKLEVSGSTLFYETTPCSGEYSNSWSPGALTFGTASLYGKNVQFNAEEGYIAFMGDANGCEVNYSEGGNHRTTLSGVEGQVLSPGIGVITADIHVGTPPQKFVVQMDTGSQDLLLYADTCMLYGINPEEDNIPSQDNSFRTCFAVASSFEGSYLEYFSDESHHPCFPNNACYNYTKPLLDELQLSYHQGDGGFCPSNSYLEGFPLSEFSKAITVLQPYSSCNANREYCGEANYFRYKDSSTFMSNNATPFPTQKDPPAFTKKVICDPCSDDLHTAAVAV